MYQESMFTDGPFKDATFIASGCYGRVYDLHNGWVVKYAMQDGTLNYLEWCKAMQDAGRGMKGMPEIDSIVHLDERRYMVTMKKYDPANEAKGDRKAVDWFVYGPADMRVEHIEVLLTAYMDYVRMNFMTEYEQEVKLRARGDLHSGNFMFDDDVLILTDPSGGAYWAGDRLLAPANDLFN